MSPTAKRRQKMMQRCCASLLLHREVMLSTARQGLLAMKNSGNQREGSPIQFSADVMPFARACATSF